MSQTLVRVCHSACVSETSKFDVVVLGSANLDSVSTTSHLPRSGETILASDYVELPGGKGLNQAVAAARMGARTAFIGCVGDDDAGTMLRHILSIENVDTSQLLTVSAPTGRAFITVDGAGENFIVVVPGANSSVDTHSITFPTTRVLLAQLEIPLRTVTDAFQRARSAGTLTVLNPAPATPLSRSLLSLCDFIVPNESECAQLDGSQALLHAGASNVITTLGEKGAEIRSVQSALLVSPYPVSVVDTVGAGDAFIGAFCAEISRGTAVHRAVTIASVAGALATTTRGAVQSLPTRTEVEAHLRNL